MHSVISETNVENILKSYEHENVFESQYKLYTVI